MNSLTHRIVLLGTIVIILQIGCSGNSETRSTEQRHFLFSYFTGNGEDGLHLAHSNDGYVWQALKQGGSFLTPSVGDAKLMRDPSIVRSPDGVYHMVWTAGWNENGIGYASSRDLINWSEQQYIPVMAHEPEARNCWAPELFYDEPTGEYLIVWSTTIPGRFPETDGQDARENRPGWNHRMYSVTTKDFESFGATQLFYDDGFNVIDGTIAKSGEQYVLFLKNESNAPFEPQKNIRLAFSDQARGPYSSASEPITGDYWAEGPTAIRIDGTWFVYFDKYVEGQFGLLVSEDLNVWREESERLSVPDGIRHGTVFEVSKETARELMSLQ